MKSHSTKRYMGITICILIIIAIVGYKIINTNRSETTNIIAIGNLSALTGTGAAIGQEERNGALLAIEQINSKGGVKGHTLQLVSEDLGFDNLKLASAVTSKLINIDHVSAIVGAQWDEPTDAVLPTIEKEKIPMVGGDVTNDVEKDTNYEYFFSTWYDNRSGIKKLLAYAQSKNLKNILIIRPVDGGFWKFTADLFTEYAPSYGVHIVDDIKLSDPFTTDYRTTLTKAKAEKPDAIFIVVTDPTQCPFMKQVHELGLTMPILGTEASGSYASLQACANNMGNSYFSTPAHTDSYKNFEALYTKRFGRAPQYPSAITAYDAVGVIASGLDTTNLGTGKVLRDAIAETKNYKGASLDPLTFDAKGYSITPLEAWEVDGVKGGTFVKVQ